MSWNSGLWTLLTWEWIAWVHRRHGQRGLRRSVGDPGCAASALVSEALRHYEQLGLQFQSSLDALQNAQFSGERGGAP